MQTTAESALEFRGVAKRYGSTSVLEDLNFTVSPGENVALIGPSPSAATHASLS